MTGALRRIVVLLALLLALAPVAASAASRRVALVIGNGSYTTLKPLANPVRDARLVGQALLQSGFDHVDIRTNLDLAGMRDAVARFGKLAQDADTAVIYFAGHGIEADDVNWFLPTDARLERSAPIASEALPLAKMLETLNRARRMRILIVDACRTDPFVARPRQATRAAAARRIVVRSIGAVDSANALVFYAAKAGTPASDGIGENSPFAAALARRLPTPGVDVRRLFGQVRDDVLAETGGRQEPFTYGTAPASNAYFVAATPEAALADADELGWSRAATLNDEAAYSDYLRLFPSGRSWPESAARYARLRAARIRLGPTAFTGRTIRISSDGRGDFRTLSEAVAAAGDGDRLILAPGLHRTEPVEIRKRVAILGSGAGRNATVLSGTIRKDNLGGLLTLYAQGRVWISGLTIRCICEKAIFAAEAELTLVDVLIEQTSEAGITSSALSLGEGASATIVDSDLRGSKGSVGAGGTEVVLVGNKLALPVSSLADAAYIVDNQIAGEAPEVGTLAGDGRMLLLGNRIDARRVSNGLPLDTLVLFHLRRATGQLVVRGNVIQPPPDFSPDGWFECESSMACNFRQAENRLVVASAASSPARRRVTRPRRP